MKDLWNNIQLILTAVGGYVGWFLGGCKACVPPEANRTRKWRFTSAPSRNSRMCCRSGTTLSGRRRSKRLSLARAEKLHLFSAAARKSRSERNCSG